MKTAALASIARLTRQRRLVLDILRESKIHLDADALYRKARARNAKISLATVYRSLAHLRRANLIQEQRLGENHAHFETARSPDHHHVTCLRCGRIVEFQTPAVEKAVRALCKREKLLLANLRLELHGYCGGCRPA